MRNFFLSALLLCTIALPARTSDNPNYMHEFMIAGGYSYCRNHFVDVGLRYYHFRNDGQTFLAFGGPAAGCTFSMQRQDRVIMPYVGWQGQMLTLGYGIRGEYATNKEVSAFCVSPELGWSFFEIFRITSGYRFVLAKNDPLELQGFRFSLVAALPLSFLKEED
jgi:hypothetical protein